MYKFNQLKAFEIFGLTDTLTIVHNIVSRVDDEQLDTNDNLCDEISNCMNDTLIYTKDQWTIIATYSTPDKPLDIYDAMEYLVIDIIDCYEEV